MDYLSVLVGALGGVAAMLAAAGFLSKSLVNHFLAKDLKTFELQLKQTLDTEVERVKGAISYRNSLSLQRIDHLRALWESVHAYGGAVAALAQGEGDKEDISRRIDNFKKAFSHAGIFLGHERFEKLYQEIGEPFLFQLVEAKDNPPERRRLFEEFMNRRWLTVLSELEQLLNN